MKRKYLLLLPTLNEVKNIKRLYKEIMSLQLNIDILFIDDGSNDGTADYLKKINKKNCKHIFLKLRSKRLGLGKAHKDGYKWALKKKYNFLLTMDSDFAHSPHYLPLLIKNIKNNDLVIGSRFLKKNSTPNWSIFRKFLTFGSIFFSKLLFKHSIDSTNSFRCYNLKTINKDFIKYCSTNDYDYFFTSLNILRSMNYKIFEIPQIIKSRVRGNSKYNFFLIIKSIVNYFMLFVKLKFIYKFN